jgi:hypothetical protein
MMKFTAYFQAMRSRPDRAMIRIEWIQQVMEHPVKEVIQKDSRIRRWAPIQETEGGIGESSYFQIERRFTTPSLTGDSSHGGQIF